MLITPITSALVGAALPFSPLAGVLGFTALPLSFFLILAGMVLTYLVLVELAKGRFYASRAHLQRSPTSPEERQHRHAARRARRFSVHTRGRDT